MVTKVEQLSPPWPGLGGTDAEQHGETFEDDGDIPCVD